MTLFHKSASAETLKAIYGKLKQIKAGAKAVKTAEANVELMEKLGSAVTVDTSLSPAAQKVMAVLITEKRNAKDLEKTFKDFYSLTYKDLPILQAVDGNAVEPLVAAWLFTAHEKLKQGAWGQPDVVAGYQKAGLRPEAEEIISLLDGNVLQDALLKLADGNLGMSSRSKKMFLAYPICRYADEALMAELCVRAPKWRSSVSGNDAPPLKSFRDAAKYSNTRAAMFFAERYHELDQYAAIRSTDADTIRDQFLSDVGLDKQGGKVYDLGTQTVTARLQKDLSFLVELPDGKTAKSLPKKGADPDKYAAANKDFTEMKKSVKKILNSRGNVLFGEFLSGRERAASDWKDAYLKNPLLREAASLVVWAQGKQTFTLRDGAPLDSKEQPYAITDEPIRVAHPMEMNADDVKAWQKYFTRHGLKQPFQQIWEPVHSAGEIAADRYTGILLPLVFFKNAEKHGLKYQYLDSVDIELQDCEARYNVAGERRHELDPDAAVEITDFRIPSYTRQANHIVALLDRWTARERIAKDDLAVMGLMPGFTLAQITEFIAAAQEANATNVLAALLEYKNANFADFDPMDEFTLEW